VQLQNTSSNTDDVDGNWLKIMVVGFLLLWVMQAFSQLCHELNWTILAQFVALSGNYFLFALVNFLVILSLTRSTETTKNDKTPSQSTQTKEYTSEQVKRLERTITERQPHLKPDLTLEELSKISSIPQRTLSSIINRHHKKNFFEYVNEHRAERAALLLLEQNGNLTMLDIMEDAGFNSKSAFNRFFKKSKGMTPTQYKNQQQKMGQ
jgi:AraC-type DNA-binding domain-containing proteins